MRVLVTGCAGFIGFHLCKRLMERGHTMVGIDNLNDYYDPGLKKARLALLGVDADAAERPGQAVRGKEGDFTFIRLGIEDGQGLKSCLEGERFDAVCHLAAQAGVRYSLTNPQTYISSNIEGFFNILEYYRHNPPGRLVFASSSSVYGNSDSVPFRERDRTDTPVSLYGATKKAGEAMAHSYSALFGIDTVGLRFFTVYGPWGRPDMAPFLFTDAIMHGRQIEVFNAGDLSRDFTYIDDITEGLYRVLTQTPATDDACLSKNFRIYNIGNSRPVALADFISTIEKITGRQADKRYVPMQPGDVKATWADTSLLERDFGYRPATPLEHGLCEFVTWYRNNYR